MQNHYRVFGHCRVFSRPHAPTVIVVEDKGMPGSLPRLAACACGGLLNESPEWDPLWRGEETAVLRTADPERSGEERRSE